MGSAGGGGQSSPQTTTQTSKTELPDFVKAPAQRYLQRAEDLSHSPFQEYGGVRVAPPSPFHDFALQGGRYAAGSVLPASVGIMNQMASGAFNSPAYIHPFLGPQLPGAGVAPGGYASPGFQGYTPQPQQPSIPTTPGMGGKAGAMMPPAMAAIPPMAPIPITPLPPELGEIGQYTPPPVAAPAPAPATEPQGHMNPWGWEGVEFPDGEDAYP